MSDTKGQIFLAIFDPATRQVIASPAVGSLRVVRTATSTPVTTYSDHLGSNPSSSGLTQTDPFGNIVTFIDTDLGFAVDVVRVSDNVTLVRGFELDFPEPFTTSRSIQSFGARVDARNVTGISVTGTSCTAASSTFTPDDVGRTICLYDGGGKIGQALVQTYTDATHVTLATSITTSAGKLAVIGTDDTAAWQAAVDWACATFAGGLVTYDGNGISLIAGPQVTGNVTSTNVAAGGAVYSYSGQILLPAVPIAHGQKVMEVSGTVPYAGIWSPLASAGDDTPNAAGLILLSTATSGWIVDVISDPQGFVFAKGSFSFLQFGLNRVTVRKLPGAGGGALNLISCAGAVLRETNVDLTMQATTWPPTDTGTASLDGSGIVLPGDGNWGVAELLYSQVTGYPKGVVYAGSANLDEVSITHCGVGMAIGTVGSTRTNDGHGSRVNRVLLLGNTQHILPLGPRQISGNLEVEPAAGNVLVDDPNGWLTGDLYLGGLLAPGGNVPQVHRVSGLLLFRTAINPYTPTVSTPVVDTMKRAGGSTCFGIADGSNNSYYPVNVSIDSNGMSAGAGGGVAAVNSVPTFRSKKISVTVTASSATGRTFAGVGTKGQSTNGDMLKLYLGNGTVSGVSLYKGTFGSGVQLANVAYTVAPSTAYAVDLLYQTSPYPNGDAEIRGYVNNVLILKYTLTAAEKAAYAGGFDGPHGYLAAGLDDGGSRMSNFSVTQAADLPYVSAGTAVLVAGTKAVANTNITANSRVRVFNTAAGGTVGALSVALTAGTGFTINSSSGSDTSTIYYEVVTY